MRKILQTKTIIGLVLVVLVAMLPGPAMGQKNTVNTLYSFMDLSDGGFPQAGLVMSSSGSFYGTTYDSSDGWGTVFELSQGSGGAWTMTTLYTFTGINGDGAQPMSDLVIGGSNTLYGTTYYGGANGYGTVFQLTQGLTGAWTETILYSFKNGNDGANPQGGLVMSGTDILYGTTYNGGTAGMGTVFQVTETKGVWSESVLYSFRGNTDGANPLSDLVLGVSTGSLFGTTFQGGSVTVTNTSSCTPSSPCTYANNGIIFELTPKGKGVWDESILYTFTGQGDGANPQSALIIGKNNVMYGSTLTGGLPANCPQSGYELGCGVVYQVAAAKAATWSETVLHTFTGVSPDGAQPKGNMALNSSGSLFGTTYAGGQNTDVCFPASYPGCGTIFQIKPPAKKGGTWTKSNLSTFDGDNGGAPNGVILNNGTLYGTTYVGGTSGGDGTVFSITP